LLYASTGQSCFRPPGFLKFLVMLAALITVGCGSSNNDFTTTTPAQNETIAVDVELPAAIPQGAGSEVFDVRLRLQQVVNQGVTTRFRLSQPAPLLGSVRFNLPRPNPGNYNLRVDLIASNLQVRSTSIVPIQVEPSGPRRFEVPPSSFVAPLPEGATNPTTGGGNPGPTGPIAVDDSYSTPHNTTLNVSVGEGVLANDTGGGAVAAVVTPPASGTLNLNPDGSFTYTPASDFSGAATFVYSIIDSTGASDNGTVTINVAPPLPPTAVDDFYNGVSNTTLNVNTAQGVLANDTSANGTVSLVSGPASGTLNLNSDGSFSYTPAGAFSGDVSFTYELTDANGDDTAEVTISIASNVIFVRGGAGGTGNSQASPRGDLQGALQAATSGTVVFILDSATPISLQGENTSTSSTDNSFFIPDGVDVIGEGTGLNPVVAPGDRPMVEGNFDMGDDTRLSGIELICQSRNGTTGVGIRRAAANPSGLTVDNCSLAGGGTDFIEIEELVGSFTLDGNTFSGSVAGAGSAYFIRTESSAAVVTINNNTFDTSGTVWAQDAANVNPTFNFTNNRSIAGAAIQQGFTLRAGNGCRPVAEVTGNNMQTSSNSFIETFEFEIFGDAAIEANVRNNTFDNGRVFVNSTNGSLVNATGTVVDVKDNVGMGGTFSFNGEHNAQVRFQDNTTSTPLGFSGLTSNDVSLTAANETQIRALIQDNSHAHGGSFICSQTANLDLALVDNQFGTQSTSGPFRLTLTVRSSGTGGALCLKGSGNEVGSNLNLFRDSTQDFLVENLSAFVDGTVVATGGSGGKNVDAGVQNAAPGTCDTPTPLP